jgi:hypothetical protein
MSRNPWPREVVFAASIACALFAVPGPATAAPARTSQTGDVNKILADARAALGGEKRLGALKTFAATGQSTRVTGNTSTPPGDFEMAFELPDRFMKKDVLAMMGNNAITRTSGFNGEAVINAIDQPPAMPGMIQIRMGPGGTAPGGTPTPEQQEQQRKQQVISGKQDFARLTLGMLLTSLTAYPLQFSYGGQAESPDGKADIVDVKGEGDFAVRLFIDTQTHLPLMASWMAREPLMITNTVTRGGPGGAASTSSGGGSVAAGGKQVTAGGGQAMTPEERDKLMKQFQDQAKEAAEKLRVVEYRLYYGDYRDVDGIKVPFKLQRSIDGKPAEEVTLEKVKINAKIDPKKFETK